MSGSTSQSYTLPLIALLVVGGGLIATFAMRGDGDGDAPAAGDAPATGDVAGGAESPADRGAPAAAPPQPGPPPTQGDITITGDDDTPAPGPSGGPTGDRPPPPPADPRFGPTLEAMTAWVAEEGYGTAPAPVLQARVDRVLAAMPDGRKPVELTFGCAEGGSDCRIVGKAPTPIDIQTFAEQVEQSPPEGEEQLPTVSIEETHSSSSGETRFKMGIYYP